MENIDKISKIPKKILYKFYLLPLESYYRNNK